MSMNRLALVVCSYTDLVSGVHSLMPRSGRDTEDWRCTDCRMLKMRTILAPEEQLSKVLERAPRRTEKDPEALDRDFLKATCKQDPRHSHLEPMNWL